MKQNEEVTFKVMVTFPYLLELRIKEYNKRNGTNFKILETLNDEVPFCVIQVDRYEFSDLFNLGYGLAVKQYHLRDEGKLEW